MKIGMAGTVFEVLDFSEAAMSIKEHILEGKRTDINFQKLINFIDRAHQ